jgi:transcription factor SFP1
MAAATAASQPIALPMTTTTNDLDLPMGSYSGSSYNQPSSYSKHFIGTPISWKAGSFTSRFYNGVSPNQLIGLEYVPISSCNE